MPLIHIIVANDADLAAAELLRLTDAIGKRPRILRKAQTEVSAQEMDDDKAVFNTSEKFTIVAEF